MSDRAGSQTRQAFSTTAQPGPQNRARWLLVSSLILLALGTRGDSSVLGPTPELVRLCRAVHLGHRARLDGRAREHAVGQATEGDCLLGSRGGVAGGGRDHRVDVLG